MAIDVTFEPQLYREGTFKNVDRVYSTRPTVFSLLMNHIRQKNSVGVDVGCGSGFFTELFSQYSNGLVIGIDSDLEQITLANKNADSVVKYVSCDMFDPFPFGAVNWIHAPYVLGYCSNVCELKTLLKHFYDSLNFGGRLVGVIDLPFLDLPDNQLIRKKEGGVVKMVDVALVDSCVIHLNFYKNQKLMFNRKVHYYSPNLFLDLLSDIGFKDVSFHKPIIGRGSSLESWPHYVQYCELGYFSADK